METIADEVIFEGQVFYQRNNVFAVVIFPLVQLKKLYKTLYDFLLNVIWSELIYGKKLDNEVAHLIGFFIFCALSWGLYQVKPYAQYMVVAFLLIWYLDYMGAKNQFKNDLLTLKVILKQQNNQLIWMMTLPDNQNNKILQSQFSLEKISLITLTKRPIYGGAFQEVMGEIWQTEVNLYDGSKMIIDEHKNVVESLHQSQVLVNKLQTEIIFARSQGWGKYVDEVLEIDPFAQRDKTGIKCRKNERKWHIYSQWKLNHGWNLCKQILKDSGFLLFIIIMAQFMINFGQFIDGIIAPFIQNSDEVIYLGNPLEIFRIDWDFKRQIQLIFPIALMVYRGWQISRIKHLYVDQYYLRFAIDNQKIAKLKTQLIDSILLLHNPDPEILIITPESAIILPKFQDEDTAKTCCIFLEKSIQWFQKSDS